MKNGIFAALYLKFLCLFRKLCSPVVFWIPWILWLKWTAASCEKYAAKVIWGSMLHAGSVTEFREKALRHDWFPEPTGGVFGFSYRIPWACFCGTIPARLGRDCNDFAELAWRWCEIHNFERIWQIASLDEGSGRMRIITVALSAGMFVFIGSHDRARYLSAKSLSEALGRYYPKETIWSVYKSEILEKN